ncbi:MAG: hypothetical protein COB69_07505 [Phycisphaera sp.]|nr:MAG: hypothetical protein COB69_07505 [Phycisphaera sp.]
MNPTPTRWIVVIAISVSAFLCYAGPSSEPNGVASDPYNQHDLVIELLVPGGPLPFECFLAQHKPDMTWSADIYNGTEVIGSGDDVEVVRHSDGIETVWDVQINLAHYDTVLTWTMIENPASTSYRGSGVLKKVRPSGTYEIQILVREATGGSWKSRRSSNTRFLPIESAATKADFVGRWRAEFSSSKEPAIAVFDVDDDGFATGTFMTTTGDYRYLAGRVDGDLLRLSVFDGAHSFLFHAKMLPDGSIAGDFWSGNWWHETWTATRDDDFQLPDAFAGTSWVEGETIDDLVFSDLDGKPQSVTELLDKQGGSIRVLEIFGTWCPNCTDAARDLKTLQEKYGDRGFTVLGLAFEHTDDMQRSTRMVRAYKERYGLDWPVLVAGLSSKKKASLVLPFLDGVRTFPTLIFLNEHNEPLAIHAGYTGSATGDAYEDMIQKFTSIIENNLE